jgi:hypothetical protein
VNDVEKQSGAGTSPPVFFRYRAAAVDGPVSLTPTGDGIQSVRGIGSPIVSSGSRVIETSAVKRTQTTGRSWLAAAALAGVFGLADARPVAEAPVPAAVEAAPSAYVAQRGGISLAQATAMAQSRFRGRVVRAETVARGDRVIHEIRILGDDGRVRTVRIDAQSGAFL